MSRRRATRAARSSRSRSQRTPPRRRARRSSSPCAERAADEAGARQAVAPRAIGGLRDPDPRPAHDLDRPWALAERERGLVNAQAVVLARDAKGLAQPSGPAAEQALIGHAAPRDHPLDAVRRLERAEQDRARGPGLAADYA